MKIEKKYLWSLPPDQLLAWGIAWKSSFTGIEGRGSKPIFAKWQDARDYCDKLDCQYSGFSHWPCSEFETQNQPARLANRQGERQ